MVLIKKKKSVQRKDRHLKKKEIEAEDKPRLALFLTGQCLKKKRDWRIAYIPLIQINNSDKINITIAIKVIFYLQFIVLSLRWLINTESLIYCGIQEWMRDGTYCNVIFGIKQITDGQHLYEYIRWSAAKVQFMCFGKAVCNYQLMESITGGKCFLNHLEHMTYIFWFHCIMIKSNWVHHLLMFASVPVHATMRT